MNPYRSILLSFLAASAAACGGGEFRLSPEDAAPDVRRTDVDGESPAEDGGRLPGNDGPADSGPGDGPSLDAHDDPRADASPYVLDGPRDALDEVLDDGSAPGSDGAVHDGSVPCGPGNVCPAGQACDNSVCRATSGLVCQGTPCLLVCPLTRPCCTSVWACGCEGSDGGCQ